MRESKALSSSRSGKVTLHNIFNTATTATCPVWSGHALSIADKAMIINHLLGAELDSAMEAEIVLHAIQACSPLDRRACSDTLFGMGIWRELLYNYHYLSA